MIPISAPAARSASCAAGSVSFGSWCTVTPLASPARRSGSGRPFSGAQNTAETVSPRARNASRTALPKSCWPIMATRIPLLPFVRRGIIAATPAPVEGGAPSAAAVESGRNQERACMTPEDTVITRRDGRVGRILLNRPKALNALDLDMIGACTRALVAWRDDPHVHAVVIEGAGDRAFCAGGDVRALRQFELDGEHHKAEAFFREEYELNLTIATYPKPYIALIDGICMGGGIGVSVHAPYRVATERAAFAMPEMAIGFFPDIGATYFLPRLPGQLGTYLGLTGVRMQGADAVHAGLATHFVRRADLPALSAALAREGAAALAQFAAPLPAFSLA